MVSIVHRLIVVRHRRHTMISGILRHELREKLLDAGLVSRGSLSGNILSGLHRCRDRLRLLR